MRLLVSTHVFSNVWSALFVLNSKRISSPHRLSPNLLLFIQTLIDCIEVQRLLHAFRRHLPI